MYHITQYLTKKSYGVLLIELLIRKKHVSYRLPQGFGLCIAPRRDEILDPQVAKVGDGEVVDVALLEGMCVKYI
ncbi:hypothetical protein U9M48_002462, partial [Paspalum notatum var. saurae]